MLYLKPPADAPHERPQRQVPLAEQTALHLERALLANDHAERQRELAAAVADDRDLAHWMLRAAEFRLDRTVNRIDEAAEWLCGHLEIELAASLTSDGPSPSNDTEWRLLALVTKLCACQQQLDDFHRRLECEKLEAMKELAYGASHEINNPLANIAARAQTLLADETDPERQRKLEAIHRQAMRAHEMIADLMLFARPPKLNLARCELRQLVRKAVDELGDLACEYGVEIACETGDEPIELFADTTQLGVAVRAIVVNSLEAVAADGHVWVAVRQTTSGGELWAEITVHDDGPGISDEVRQHMFDPFYSGREAGRGLGFGLSKCWRIVTDHGGHVVVQGPSGGAEIVIRMKAAGALCLP